jgi:hypothetical protein
MRRNLTNICSSIAHARNTTCAVAPNQAIAPPACKHECGINNEVLAAVADIEVVKMEVPARPAAAAAARGVSHNGGSGPPHCRIRLSLVSLEVEEQHIHSFTGKRSELTVEC